MDEPVGLLKRCMDYFGMTSTEARVEYPKLTEQDKNDLVDEFNKAGMPTVLSAKK